jgi:site-specific recombinase XerD
LCAGTRIQEPKAKGTLEGFRSKEVGMARITHRGLRQLFATRCIESGVDVPTVNWWLGHKDGGTLAMKVYGHLRDGHSNEMVKLVSVTKPAAEKAMPVPTKNVA